MPDISQSVLLQTVRTPQIYGIWLVFPCLSLEYLENNGIGQHRLKY